MEVNNTEEVKRHLRKEIPRSMEQFKKNAKKFAREMGHKHIEGLDAYARHVGLESFYVARQHYENQNRP